MSRQSQTVANVSAKCVGKLLKLFALQPAAPQGRQSLCPHLVMPRRLRSESTSDAPSTTEPRLVFSSGLRDACLQLHRQQELEEPCGGEEPVKGCGTTA